MTAESDLLSKARVTVGEAPLRMLIDGSWVRPASGGVFDVVDPGTGDVVAQASRGGAADVDAAVAAAFAANAVT